VATQNRPMSFFYYLSCDDCAGRPRRGLDPPLHATPEHKPSLVSEETPLRGELRLDGDAGEPVSWPKATVEGRND
jgi:hypothetical protein